MSKIGRPKNPRIRTMENKIQKLEQTIEELIKAKASDIDISDLDHIAVGCVKKNNKYYLQIIKYNPVTKIGKVTEEIDACDAEHRAAFEYKKYVAYNKNIFKEIKENV